jgi:uncharacterized protein YndB with AHSA1/START domain
MRFIFALLSLAFASIAAPARAEVAAATPGGFLLQSEAIVAAPPEAAWRALLRIQHWWSSAHTYSGDAARLRLEPRAGGCWCERWDGQSVEHARVVLVMERESVRTLRAIGGLGPLQALGATGVLTFTISPDRRGAKLTMTYRVSGDPGIDFSQIAAPVDGVLMEQFARLTHYIEAGSPD